MNSLRFNGGTLNGARVVAALALVACTATASISGAATYVHKSGAGITSSASIVVNPYRKTFGDTGGAFIGSSYFQVLPCLVQRANGQMTVTAEFVPYSLRSIPGAVEVVASVDILAIPASTFGACNTVASVDIEPVATKVQPGNAAIDVLVEIEPVPAIISRNVLSDVTATADLRVETCINHKHEAYWEPTSISTVDIQDAGIVIKQVGALITGQAFLDGDATYRHSTHAAIDTSVNVNPDGVVICSAKSNIVSEANVVGDILYILEAVANVDCEGDLIIASPKQEHSAASQTVSSLGSVIADATKTHYIAPILIAGQSTINADITYDYRSSSDVFVSAEVTGNLQVSCMASGYPVGTAIIEAVPHVPIPFLGEGVVLGTCEVEAAAKYKHAGFAEFMGVGALSPIGYENLMKPVASNRLFVRPKSVRIFSRPASTSSFSRS